MVSFPRTREKACKGTIFFLYMQAHARFSLIFVKKMLNNLIGGHNYDKYKWRFRILQSPNQPV